MVAVAVFDTDALVGFLNAPQCRPCTLCAVNYSELLIGPIRAGSDARDHVDAMLGHFAIDVMTVDMAFAKRAAAVRARTGPGW